MRSELEQKILTNRSKGEIRGGMPPRDESSQNGLIYAKQLSEMPEYSNETIKAMEQMLGAFEYDQDEEVHFGNDLITRGPYALDNGSIYQGQWSKEGLRKGRGI